MSQPEMLDSHLSWEPWVAPLAWHVISGTFGSKEQSAESSIGMLAVVALGSTGAAADAAPGRVGCTRVDVDMGGGAEVSGSLPSAPQPTRNTANAVGSKKSSVDFIRTTPAVASPLGGLRSRCRKQNPIPDTHSSAHDGYVSNQDRYRCLR